MYKHDILFLIHPLCLEAPMSVPLFIYCRLCFPGFPSAKFPIHPPPPASMRVLPHLPIPSCLTTLVFPGHWGIEPSQDQGPPLPLILDKAILCYICSWSHGSPHVYSLVGSLVPGSFGGSGWLILLFFLWGCKPLQLLQSFP